MVIYSLSFTLALLLLHVPVILAAIGPVTNLSVVNAAIAPDGFQRSAVLANGVFPGPLISGKKGDNFKVNVSDLLTDDTMEKVTSVHWHGMSGTNYNDGAGFVTQCPIIPNNSYEYDWTVPYQAGTFWYHSHISTQYCDGLRGPLVIYDPQDPHAHLYDHDDDSTVITLADWYHLPFAKIARPAVPDSILINGLGRFVGGPSSPLAVINVEPSKRYRFRLISMSCAPFFTFSIDGHNLTVIESDGINTSPLIVDSIQIFAGQRYSFILDAKANVGNYWIRAQPDSSYTGDPRSSSGGINSAILRYKGAAEVDPITKQENSTIPLSETNLHPLENPGAPGMHGAADVTINLDLDFDGTKKQFLVNGISFTPPSVPVLLQILSGFMQASNLLPNGSVFTLPRNKVVEISIPPGGAIEGPHPFHLHGHPFDVIRTAGNSSYNYDNPVRRDVTSIGDPGDNVTIRFFTNNPGPWLLHCHIETHLEMGLAIVFAEEPQDIASSNHVTSDWEQLCPKFNQFNSGARSVNAARRLSPIPFWLSMQVFQNAWSFVRRTASFGYS